MVECADRSLYCGITTDLQRRVGQHNSGRGAKYTRSRTPVRLVASWLCDDHGDALRKERAFKRLRREQKLAAVEVCASKSHNDSDASERVT